MAHLTLPSFDWSVRLLSLDPTQLPRVHVRFLGLASPLGIHLLSPSRLQSDPQVQLSARLPSKCPRALQAFLLFSFSHLSPAPTCQSNSSLGSWLSSLPNLPAPNDKVLTVTFKALQPKTVTSPISSPLLILLAFRNITCSS